MPSRIILRPRNLLPPITLRPSTTCRPFTSTTIVCDDDHQELVTARKWLAQFTPDSIPREFCKISFARSSSSDFNKLNAKATVRLDLKKSRDFFPSLIMERIRSCPQTTRYLTESDELLFQSDIHRKQGANVADCFKKLYEVIVDAAGLPEETSAEQKDHVVKVQ